MSDSIEVRGRLLMWFGAIGECEQLLALWRRADTAFFHEPERRKALESYLGRMQAFARQQPDYDPNMQKSAHHDAFQAKHPEPFPTLVECHRIRDAAAMLAIVIFCQLFTKGEGQSGVAAASSDRLRRDVLDAVLGTAFPNQQELQRFRDLCALLLQRRNAILGHAAASQFDIRQAPHVSAMRLIAPAALDGIDIRYWASSLQPLARALGERYSSIAVSHPDK